MNFSKIHTLIPTLSKNSSGIHNLKILDLYDYYIFVTVNDANTNMVLDYAIKLYQEFDISASLIDTKYRVLDDELENIYNVFGRTIQVNKDIYNKLDGKYNYTTSITPESIIDEILKPQ